MNLLSGKSPIEFGKQLLQLGLLQEHSLNSYGMDVVHNNTSSSQEIVDENNKLVFLLGSSWTTYLIRCWNTAQRQ